MTFGHTTPRLAALITYGDDVITPTYTAQVTWGRGWLHHPNRWKERSSYRHGERRFNPTFHRRWKAKNWSRVVDESCKNVGGL